MRFLADECVTKSLGTNSFFQSYSKESLKQTAFLKATLRVMTEGFLKPNAKTAFFKAILKFCTTNQLIRNGKNAALGVFSAVSSKDSMGR